MDLRSILFLSGLFGFLAFMVWFIVRSKRRTREAVREAAGSLGLTADESDLGEGWQVEEGYRGSLDGMGLTLAIGQKLVRAGTNVVPLTGVLVEARAPVPAAFPYRILRYVGGMPRDVDHPDAEFNAHCAVTGEDGEKALSLLDSPGLRQIVQKFLQDGKGSASIDETGAFCVVFNAHYCGAEGVEQRARENARLTKTLHERAVKLGFAGNGGA